MSLRLAIINSIANLLSYAFIWIIARIKLRTDQMTKHHHFFLGSKRSIGARQKKISHELGKIGSSNSQFSLNVISLLYSIISVDNKAGKKVFSVVFELDYITAEVLE